MKAQTKVQGTRKKIRQEIPESFDGKTLEEYLRQKLGFTRAQISSMKFRTDGILLNGVRTRVKTLINKGDILEISIEEKNRKSAHLEMTSVTAVQASEILYEDQDVIVVWKDAGVVLHPSHGHYKDSLSNRLHAYFEQKREAVVIRSIGRLDKDTSGLIVFAKNNVAAARLWKQKEDGRFEKEYIARCRGHLKDQTQTGLMKENWNIIDAPIGEKPGSLMKMQVDWENGKSALTKYRIIRQNKDSFWIRVRIQTGRTHQIRVHMAWEGHPLEGDPLYDPLSDNLPEKKMILCAWKVWFEQPFTGEKLEFGVQMSEDLKPKIKDRR